MLEKRVKKFGQGSPPPFSDNARKKTFFFRMASLSFYLSNETATKDFDNSPVPETYFIPTLAQVGWVLGFGLVSALRVRVWLSTSTLMQTSGGEATWLYCIGFLLQNFAMAIARQPIKVFKWSMWRRRRRPIYKKLISTEQGELPTSIQDLFFFCPSGYFGLQNYCLRK